MGANAEIKMEHSEKELINYKCSWCNFEFEKEVGIVTINSKTYSSQVVCPNCGNFIKMWKK